MSNGNRSCTTQIHPHFKMYIVKIDWFREYWIDNAQDTYVHEHVYVHSFDFSHTQDSIVVVH